MAKKLFLTFLILFILAGSALTVYNLFIKDSDDLAKNNNNQSRNFAIYLIGQEKAFALTLGDNSQTIKYYISPKGHVLESSLDGLTKKTVSSVDLIGLDNIIWSPDKQKVIAEYSQTTNPAKKNTFDYTTKKVSPLDENTRSVAWAPNSQKIVYHFKSSDGSSNNVSIANADGSGWRTMLESRMEDFSLSWPVAQKIYLQTKASGLAPGLIYSIDASNGDLKNILSNLNGLAAIWSPDSQKMLYQATDDKGKNIKIYLADANSGNAKSLNIATLVEKCVWSADSQKIFCAVPQKISEFAILPDDYQAGRVAFKDDFYIIEPTDGKETKIARSDDEQSFDATGLTVSRDNNYLFFINRYDNLVYGIDMTGD